MSKGRAYKADRIFWAVNAVVEEPECILWTWSRGCTVDNFGTGRSNVVL